MTDGRCSVEMLSFCTEKSSLQTGNSCCSVHDIYNVRILII